MTRNLHAICIRYRTARKAHRCEGCLRRAIAPGHRYEVHTIFPGHDVLSPRQPFQLKLCLACAVEHDEGAHLAAEACGAICHGYPCALPFGHAGDYCSCRYDAAESARAGDRAEPS
jgi:hypothetical protein